MKICECNSRQYRWRDVALINGEFYKVDEKVFYCADNGSEDDTFDISPIEDKLAKKYDVDSDDLELATFTPEKFPDSVIKTFWKDEELGAYCAVCGGEIYGDEIEMSNCILNEINSFKGEYSFLSNFEKCSIEFEGLTYPSVEHAFQAAKTLDTNKRLSFTKGSSCCAKRMGRCLKLRPGWEEIKDSVMYACLKNKFRNDDMRKKLIATGDAVLIEGNNHGDRYWGMVNGEGQNKLGLLLMQIRNEIRCADL